LARGMWAEKGFVKKHGRDTQVGRPKLRCVGTKSLGGRGLD